MENQAGGVGKFDLGKMAQMFGAAAAANEAVKIPPEELEKYKARAMRVVKLLDHPDAAVQEGLEEIFQMVDDLRKDFILEPEFYVRYPSDGSQAIKLSIDDHMISQHAGARDALGQIKERIMACKKFIEKLAADNMAAKPKE